MSDDGNDTNNIHVDTPDEPVLTPPIETVNHNITSTLKRKNEDADDNEGNEQSANSHSGNDTINSSSIKRIALDSEQLDLQDKEEELQQTAPIITNNSTSHLETESEELDKQNEDANKTQETLEPADDPTFIQLRMYCPVKEASTIVGRKGETINHLREKANVRITVSENLKGVPERIVAVKGPAENVARAFGLITRVILEEPEDEPASINSQQYNLKLLIPHPMIGFIIGKQGLKFREIEENSAAKLKAAENALPYSTDRVLSVMGVGDAIHIAVYYIAQVMLEHKEVLKKHKVVLYNPANYQPTDQSLGGRQRQPPSNSYNNPMGYQAKLPPFTVQPQHFGSPVTSNPNAVSPVGMQPSVNIPPQNQFTDEFGNTIVGEVITTPPIQAGQDKYNQDVFVANSSIGSVIGKRGNNIKHIRETSACTYVKIEPDKGQSMMLGGGKGMTNIRKLTLTGTLNSIQTAIYLINQRINADRERNTR
ncbi:KH domain family protein [Candida albicans]|uniref:KH domain family protein n=1 Tax=Candida albicans TaxID=5476 RepID=A0A8H6BZI0_CANAX|nr:KH domain family protein [Candida albicans]